MVCPNCQAESAGRFCSQCGAALPPPRCTACDAELPAGARYCTRCGEPAAGQPASGAVAWATAAVLIGLVLVVFVLPAFRGSASGAGSVGGATPSGAATGGASAPPLTGTPREQADRLFNRVMESFAAGDSAGGRAFLPMAIEAYRLAAPLDADGFFHLSLLHGASGDAAAALAAADSILAGDPNHLLGLAAAAQAARALGDDGSAREYYRRYLAVYDAETARGVVEYMEHAPMLPIFLDAARQYLGE